MAVTRIRGQELEIRLVQDGILLDTLTAIQSFEWNPRFATMEADRLGATTTELDDIYHGVSGRMQMHLESGAYANFLKAARDRARRVRNVTFSIVGTYTNPDGTQTRIALPNIFFDESSVSASERAGFVTFSIAFKSEDFNTI